jgi:hypothetical protein
VLFKIKNIFLFFAKTPTTTLVLYVVVNFEVVGLGPELKIILEGLNWPIMSQCLHVTKLFQNVAACLRIVVAAINLHTCTHTCIFIAGEKRTSFSRLGKILKRFFHHKIKTIIVSKDCRRSVEL